MKNIVTVSVDFKDSYTEEQTLCFRDDMFRKGWSNSILERVSSNSHFRIGDADIMITSLKFVKNFSNLLKTDDISIEAKRDVVSCTSSNDILSYIMFSNINVAV